MLSKKKKLKPMTWKIQVEKFFIYTQFRNLQCKFLWFLEVEHFAMI